jgi:hypothetical protein
MKRLLFSVFSTLSALGESIVVGQRRRRLRTRQFLPERASIPLLEAASESLSRSLTGAGRGILLALILSARPFAGSAGPRRQVTLRCRSPINSQRQRLIENDARRIQLISIPMIGKLVIEGHPMRRIPCVLLVVLLSNMGPFVGDVRADTFGSRANSFEIEFVTIGNPGNPPDASPNPAGAVPYEYRIGKYEISEQIIDKANALGGLGITHDMRGREKPATSVSWYEAARFVNWLNTSTGSMPAYKFDASGNFQLWTPTDPGHNPNNLYRNRLARYFLPSLNEWHKAAYYDPSAAVYYDYPTRSDSIPDGIDFVGDTQFDAVFEDGGSNLQPNDIINVGLLSPYGTAGQGGNASEWVETAFDRVNDVAADHRRAPGGSWRGIYTGLAAWNTGIGDSPNFDFDFIGVRVARVVPEPSTFLLLGIFFVMLIGLRRRAGAKEALQCDS